MKNETLFPYIIETHLVDHCNLNCQGCSHFAPLVPGEVFTDFTGFTRDLQKVGQLFQDIYEMRLMGGEPLLHPEINSFISYSRQVFPRAHIAISTNGVLLKKMPEAFWQTCAANDAHIKLTNYPIQLDFKTIKQFGKDYQVKIKIPKQVNAFFQFININGDSDPQKSFQTCRAMYTTPFLRDGKLYTCSFAPHVHLFNEYFKKDIPVSENDYLNLDDTSPKEVYEFLSHPIPLCKWCKTKRPYTQWGRSDLEISEWIEGEANGISSFLDIQKHRLISAYHHQKQTSEMRKRNKNEN